MLLKLPAASQDVFENHTENKAPFTWGDRTTVTYYLLPGVVFSVHNQARLCVASRSQGIPHCLGGQKPPSGCVEPDEAFKGAPTYAQGQNLSAWWIAVGADDEVVDLSGKLTAVLRAQSNLQVNSDAWTSIHKRFEPDGLMRAGYGLCPAGDGSHDFFRTCYCRQG